MVPIYRTKHQREPKRIITKRAWTDNSAVEKLQYMLETSDWEIFIDDDLDDSVERITDYIKYLEESNIYEKKISVHANSKPWLTRDIKLIIKEKHAARKIGDRTRLASIQKELNKVIFKAKKSYHKDTIDKMLVNPRAAWQGLKLMCGKTPGTSSREHKASKQLVDDLNKFYIIFESDEGSNMRTGTL
jgi:hypothetical protein